MPVIKRRPLVKWDLIGIWDRIAEDSERVADAFVDRIDEKLGILARQPKLGRTRDELMEGLRSSPVKSYVIFYLPLPDGIEVVRVLHGARDIEKIFQTED